MDMDMDMEPSRLILPAPKIKVEDDDSDIIDLDNFKTPEDLVYDWNSKVRMRLKQHYLVDYASPLISLMQWYIQFLKDEAENLEDLTNLKPLIAKHIEFFKLYCIQLKCLFNEDYLEHMEEILSIYLNMEIKSFTGKKGGNKRAHRKNICRKLISMVNLYLMDNENHVYHVMMKLKLSFLSEESKELVNLLYRKVLTKQPKDKSDLAFCRSYILYQKWKTIRKSDEWEKMDEVIYKLYDQSPESVRNNSTLKQILFPQSPSVFNTLIHISEKHIIIAEEYFKYMKTLKLQEENVTLSALRNMDINGSNCKDLNDDAEEREFNEAYHNFVQVMATLSEKNNYQVNDPVIKVESEDDDDCQIVNVNSIGHSSEDTDLIHEILEDDLEIIYLKKKEHQGIIQKKKKKETSVSFLDSIDDSSCGEPLGYFYGIVTPPSDNPSDEHNVTTTDANLYANIVSACSHEEIDAIDKEVPENMHITTSADVEPITMKNHNLDSLGDTTNNDRLSIDVTELQKEVNTQTTDLDSNDQNDKSDDLVNNDNISQSNFQDGEEGEEIHIEEPILLQNEEEIYEEELSFIIEEALPIGANVNISMSNDVDESSTDSNVSNRARNLESEQVELTGNDVENRELIVSKEVEVPLEPSNNVTRVEDMIPCSSSEDARTHTADEFSKFEENIRLQWNMLKETYNLDEIFSGPISKKNGISSCVNPVTNFDLFSPNQSVVLQEHTPQTPTSSSANSSGDVTSPAYEGIDDFRTYYFKVAGAVDPVISDDKATKRAFRAEPQSSGKRIRIAEDVIESSNRSVPNSPTGNPPVLQSILKKTSSYVAESVRQNGKRLGLRISRHMMNLKSLAEYNVKPNDPCLQSAPCVVIERLSKSEISQWLRVSEISRKIRLEKQQAQFASSQRIYRVDYDKQTSHINENDVVRYNTPDGRQWRSSSNLHTKSSSPDEAPENVLPSTASNVNMNVYLHMPQPPPTETSTSIKADKDPCPSTAGTKMTNIILPLKKRKHLEQTKCSESEGEERMEQELVDEIIKMSKLEKNDEDISYPAAPMISIAELQEKFGSQPRVKTPAERKEMPPVLPYDNKADEAKIITEQYNNHTYNNPTINYHMSNAPFSFYPYSSLPYFPPILLPINSTAFDLVNRPQPMQQLSQEEVIRPKREKRRGRKREN